MENLQGKGTVQKFLYSFPAGSSTLKGGKNMKRKKLEELNLLSNFLFGTVITHPVYGPYVGRRMLETILRR